jgi:hypothetical protein
MARDRDFTDGGLADQFYRISHHHDADSFAAGIRDFVHPDSSC